MTCCVTGRPTNTPSTNEPVDSSLCSAEEADLINIITSLQSFSFFNVVAIFLYGLHSSNEEFLTPPPQKKKMLFAVWSRPWNLMYQIWKWPDWGALNETLAKSIWAWSENISLTVNHNRMLLWLKNAAFAFCASSLELLFLCCCGYPSIPFQ